ncbi:MAG: hypothetical protein Kow0065_19540 [Methylomicrobium sp.]
MTRTLSRRLFLSMRGIGQVALVGALLLWVFETGRAEEVRGVVVVNSSRAVKHYVEVQDLFAKSVPVKAVIALDGQTPESAKKQIRSINAEVIYVIGSKAYLLAQEAAEDRPVIFSSVLNWQRLPLTDRTYGVANELASGMQLMTCRYLFPAIKRIGVVYSERFNKEWFADAQRHADEVGIELIGRPVESDGEQAQALAALLPRVDALWLISDPVVLSSREAVSAIFDISAARQKPVIAYSEIFARLGATLVISADIPTIVGQAASLANDLIAKQAVTQRIVDPAGSYIILNRSKVNEYRLELNEEALGAVNQIID